MTRATRTIARMTTTTVAVGICLSIAARGVIAARDARKRRRDAEPLEARIARAVARAEAEVAAQEQARAA